ncbi:MAG: hypothetical protein AAB071_04170 [Bacteroidota bacterium]
MNFRISTIEEIAKVFLRIGEATIIGAGASMFVDEFPFFKSLLGLGGGIFLAFACIIIHNKADLKGK